MGPTSGAGLIHKPIDADVLCGRGRKIRVHPGNQVYISLIREKKSDYDRAAKGWKLEIVRSVVRLIRDRNGRFLQSQGSNYWMDIGETKALAKTAQAFRDYKESHHNKSDDDDSDESNKNKVSKRTKTKSIAGMRTSNIMSGRFGGGIKPSTAGGKPGSPASSSSEEEESDESEQDEDDDGKESSEESSVDNDDENDDGGDISETETEDSFPTSYRKR